MLYFLMYRISTTNVTAIGFLLFNICSAQLYQLGDTVQNFGAPICENGNGSWSYDEYGNNRIIFLSIFASWWGGCQAEAPQLEAIQQQFLENNVILLTAGKSWEQPYNCSEWATNFGLSIPILDDESDSLASIFGGSIPHNVVIDGNGQIVYTAPGHNIGAIINVIQESLNTIVYDTDNDGILDNADNCIDIFNPSQNDFDFDNIGDECDNCDNLNVFIDGNIYGEIDNQNNYSIDIFDLLSLLDIIISNNTNSCGYQIGDITGDGRVNILDAIAIVQLIAA